MLARTMAVPWSLGFSFSSSTSSATHDGVIINGAAVFHNLKNTAPMRSWSCPSAAPKARFAYAVITGRLYHATRVDSMLATIIPHMEAVDIWSDHADPAYCAEELPIPKAMIREVYQSSSCMLRAKVDVAHCEYMLAQVRWPYGLFESSKRHRHAQWISIIDDDSFVVVPALERVLLGLNSSSPVYAMGRLGWGGAGHYINHAAVKLMLKEKGSGKRVAKSYEETHCNNEMGMATGSEQHLNDCYKMNTGGKIIELPRSDSGSVLLLDANKPYWRSIRDLDAGMAYADQQRFFATKLEPVIVVCVKVFGEAARLLYRLFYLRETNLLVAIP